jgi:acyl carrier protein
VTETAVTVFQAKTGDKRLAAYVVSKNKQLAGPDLRRFLEPQLPDFMLPSAFVFLDALPLTPSGKIDRKSLPNPGTEAKEPERVIVAPRNATEESLAEIWSEVLGRSGIGVHDDFFELGGHSLLMTQVISRIRSGFQVELPMGAFFEKPTIEALASEIEQLVLEEINSLSDEEVALNARSSPC